MKSLFKKTELSHFVLGATLLLLAWMVFSHTPHKIISWDIFGYYLYLPFTFIYNDLGLRNFEVLQQIMDTYQNTEWFYQALPQDGGVWVMKYPMGMALLYLPWFVVGHVWALLGGGLADGFSTPYQLSLLYGSFVYTLIGLVYFRKSLRHFFNPVFSSILLVITVFGTNFMVLTVWHGQGLMSHNYLFFLFSLLLWNTLQWHAMPTWKNSAALGILIGLSALSRPTELLVAIVPVLWGVHNKDSFRQKMQLIQRHWPKVFLSAVLVMLLGSMQLIYFKTMTGKFLFNSYGGNAGEGMEFLHPYIFEVLFSFRKGWLVYTPVMAFAIIGFVWLYREKREQFYALLVYFLLSFYTIASWSCWWYADSFSQRAVIPMYVFLALPMGFMLEHLLLRHRFTALISSLILSMLLMLNIFQSRQFLKGIIHSSRMTKEYYKAVFLKNRIPANATDLLLVDRNKAPEQLLKEQDFVSRRLMMHNFGVHPQSEAAPDGQPAIKLNAENPFAPALDMTFDEMGVRTFGILKLHAEVWTDTPLKQNPFALTATFFHNNYAYYYNSFTPDTSDVAVNKWVNIEMLYLIPEVRRPDDLFRFTVYLKGKESIWVRMTTVDLLEPKK